MTQFVIDIDDSQEKWDALYAEIAQRGESARAPGPSVFEVPGLDDLPHPYLWYLAIAHGPR